MNPNRKLGIAMFGWFHGVGVITGGLMAMHNPAILTGIAIVATAGVYCLWILFTTNDFVPSSKGHHPSGPDNTGRVAKQTACENLTSLTERQGMGERELSVACGQKKAPNGGAGSLKTTPTTAGMPTL